MIKRGYEHTKAQACGKARDYYICQFCGKTESIQGHHILDYQYGGAPYIGNIVSVCKDCHRKLHIGEIDINVF